MAPYLYQPLALPHETRVLTILPGRFDDEIQCKLSHIKFESGETYDALSYCWGASVAHQLDLDAILCRMKVSSEGPTVEPISTVRDLLGDPEREWRYIKFGGHIPSGTILCDGLELTIGGELFRAMRYLRNEKTPLRIWIDAVCINQADMQERTEHVKIMGSIYQNASKVQIWLGAEINLETKICRALRELNSIFRELAPKLEKPDNTPAFQSILCQSHPQWYHIEWYALAHLLDRAWFGRTWVVQELANAKEAEIIIGRHHIPWVAIDRVMTKLHEYRVSDYIPHTSAFRNVLTMGSLRRMRKEGRWISADELPSILDKLRDLLSTLPHDKIYGLIGIMDPSTYVRVDYSSNAEDLFIALAAQYLEHGKTEILYYCGQPQHPTSLNLPSWVPNWTRRRWTTPFLNHGLPARAAGNKEPQLSIDIEAGIMHIQGRLLDKVAQIADEVEFPLRQFDPYDETAWEPSQDLKEKTTLRLKASQRKLRDGFEQAVRIAWPDSDHFTWKKYENMWRTFMCNHFVDGSVPTEDFGIAWEFHMQFLAWRTANEDEDPKDCYHKKVIPEDASRAEKREKAIEGGEMQRDIITVGDAQKRWCYHRRFFVSQADRYGWAVDGAQPGDHVAVLYGCNYPFLLRESSDATYKIIGDCYIHGLMDGEGLEAEFEEQEFVIS